MIRWSCKNLLQSPGLWIATVVLALSLISGVYDEVPYSAHLPNGLLYFFSVTTSVGIAHVVLPAIVAFPAALMYREEAGGAMYYHLIRSDRKKYISAKLFAGLFAEAVCVAGAVILFVAYCAFYGKAQIGKALYNYQGSVWEAGVIAGRSAPVFAGSIVAFLLYALPWSLVSLVVSTYTRNRYLVMAASFLVCQFLNIAGELIGWRWLRPDSCLLKGATLQLWGGGLSFCVLYVGVFCLGLCAFFSWRIRRKLKNG